MSMPSQTDYQRLLNFISLVKKKPKKYGSYFFLLKDNNTFVIDGKRLKFLPAKYSKLYTMEEFYVHINADTKTVMYAVWDIEDYISCKRKNEECGYMEWDEVERMVLSFFISEGDNLTESITNYTETGSAINAEHSYPRQSTHDYVGHRIADHINRSASSSPVYDHSAYKEREEIYEKITSLVKEHKTSQAVDFVQTMVAKFIDEKKFESLDMILRVIAIDKLNLPVMLTLLRSTNSHSDQLRARKDFFDKVSGLLNKIQPAKKQMVLKEFNAVVV